jgi:hypothetical protein
MAFVHSPKIVTDGLILALDAGNAKSYPGSGTTWYDKSGYGNNGTLTNGPTFNSGSLGSIVFDGADDYTSISHSNVLNLLEVFTLSFWVYPTRNNTQDYICSKNNSYAVIIGYQPGYVNFYNLRYQPTTTATQIPVSNNQWVNIVYSKDLNSRTNNWRGYKNGESVFTLTQNFTLTTNTSDLLIGSAEVTLNFFKGNIATSQIYNRALSAQEVLQNYNATKGRFGL